MALKVDSRLLKISKMKEVKHFSWKRKCITPISQLISPVSPFTGGMYAKIIKDNKKNSFIPLHLTLISDVGSGGDVQEMDDDDDDEEEAMVSIGGTKVSYHEVTEDMVAKMTPAEKEQYIRIGQEMYQDMYE